MLPTGLKLPTVLGMPGSSDAAYAPGWANFGASLDVDFINDRSWLGGQERSVFAPLTFARSTVASYYDVNGILQWAPINTPRIDYHPITHVKLGLLSEQAIGNYCLRSNEFTDAAWSTKTNVTLTAAAAIGPDGLMSATKIEATTTAVTNLSTNCFTAGNASGNTFSLFVKKGNSPIVANSFTMRNDTTSTNIVAGSFNFDTGTFSGAQSAGMSAQPLPNGWWRISLSSVTGFSANDTIRIYIGWSGGSGTAGDYLYVFGAQVERQVMATSYFPTTTAIATRGQDICDVACSAFAYNALAGTLMARFKSMQAPTAGGSVNSGAGLYVAGDSGNTERCNLYWYVQTGVSLRMGSNGRNGNVSQWDITAAPQPPNTFVRTGVAWQANDIAFSAAGSGPSLDASATVPTADRLAFGRGLDNSQYLNGHVDRVTYWPFRKTNAELVALTGYIENASLATTLYSNGELGFLLDSFAELDELFVGQFGPTNVAADGDLVGLLLDDSMWRDQTLAQVVAAAPELRGLGAVGLLGTATAATYDPSTGIGSATRGVDGSNQSYVAIPMPYGCGACLVDITPANGVYLRGTVTGLVIATPTNGVRQQVYVAHGTQNLYAEAANNNTTATFTLHSVKPIPGNPSIPAPAGVRLAWKANAGKPYLLGTGGANNGYASTFYPFASGSGLTMFAAFNATAGASIAIGGGNTATNKRATMGLQSSGHMSIGWGTEIAETVIVDRRNTNMVMLVTGDVNGRDVWLDGQNVTSLFVAASGFPDSTGGALAVAGRQNALIGSLDRNFGGNLYAAGVLDRRLSIAEIAYVTTRLQALF